MPLDVNGKIRAPFGDSAGLFKIKQIPLNAKIMRVSKFKFVFRKVPSTMGVDINIRPSGGLFSGSQTSRCKASDPRYSLT